MNALKLGLIPALMFLMSCEFFTGPDHKPSGPRVNDDSQAALSSEEAAQLAQGGQVEVTFQSGEGGDVTATVTLENGALILREKDVTTVFEKADTGTVLAGEYVAVQQVIKEVEREIVEDGENAIVVDVVLDETSGTVSISYDVVGTPRFVGPEPADELAADMEAMARETGSPLEKHAYTREGEAIVVQDEGGTSVISNITVSDNGVHAMLTEGDVSSELNMTLHRGTGDAFEGSIWTGVMEGRTFYAYFDGHGTFYLVEEAEIIDVVIEN